MQGLKNILRSQAFLIGVLLLFVIALILTLGAWLAWSVTLRLILVVGVLALATLWMLVGMVRANRHAAGIEQSLRMQAERQRMGVRPDRQGEIQALQEELERSIHMLKQSKLGRGRRGTAALYALPWYLFIGPPAAGKTTAIINSGLNFPLGTNRRRGIGGTRNCDWFFSDAAILLDTAGRYVTEQEDTEEWQAFLATLRKHRRHQPINGVIVGVSITELIDAAPDEVEWHADTIRHRTDELVRHLGVRFPVYLVFTKCDLLQGFVEFFDEFGRKEREQIWGVTLDEEPRQHGECVEVFEQEFQRIADVLTKQRLRRLVRPMRREERHKVFVFPMEFAALKEKLALFVDRLFLSNPYQETPVFRGFYFTSGTQEGVPIDRVIQKIVQQFDLPVGLDGPFTPQTEAKSYFIKELFTDVIIPDQYMVRTTSSTALKGRTFRAGVVLGLAVLLSLFVLGVASAYRHSAEELRGVQAAAVAVAQPGAEEATLAQMDKLRSAVLTLEEAPFLSRRMYKTDRVLVPAHNLYLQRARAFVAAHPFSVLKDRLGSAQGSIEGEAWQRLYEDLQAYLLLTSDRSRLEEAANQDLLADRLIALTQKEDDAPLSTAEREQLERQHRYFVQELSRDGRLAFEVDPGLLRQVRGILNEVPGPEALYTRIKQEGSARFEPLSLASILGGQEGMFRGQPQVAGFYTKAAWEGFVQQAITEQSRATDRSDWVLGTSGQSATTVDKEALEQPYFREYGGAWLRFLREVQYSPFSDVWQAVGALKAASNQSSSPVLRILARATVETQFGEALPAEAGISQAKDLSAPLRGTGIDSLQTGLAGSHRQQPNPVEQQFAWLHGLKATQATSGGADPSLTAALQALEQFGNELEALAADGEAMRSTAASSSRDRYLFSVRQLRMDPEVRRHLFEDLVEAGGGTIVQGTRRYLSERWQEEVCAPFKSSFAGTFPFEVGSTQDADPRAVEDFFHPQQGVLARFVEERLRPVLGYDLQSGKEVQLSPEAQQFIQQAQHIGKGLFSGGAMRLQFELLPEQPEGSGVGQYVIEIHGKQDVYSMGTRIWTGAFEWPGRPDASLQVIGRGGLLAEGRYTGEWAWLRMLQQARVVRQSSTLYEIRWPFRRGRIVARYTLRPINTAFPFDDAAGVFSLQCPEQLIAQR